MPRVHRPDLACALRWTLALPWLVLACQPVPELDRYPSRPIEEGSEAGAEAEAELEGAAEDPGNEEGGGDEDTNDSGSDPDISNSDVIYDCEPRQSSSCPKGERCAPVRDTGKTTRLRCVEDIVVHELWDPCDQRNDGADGCPSGSACLEADADSQGYCLPLCSANSECPNGNCRPHEGSFVPYCEVSCDPLADNCKAELVCRQNSQSFGCGLAAPTRIVKQGESCGEGPLDGICDVGLVCLPGARQIGCNTNRCCTPLCDVEAEENCDPRFSCLAFLTPPVAPDLKHVGACLIPAK